jgi:murein endopeptidase
LAVAILFLASSAHAERYVMQRGETLEHVAVAHGCTTEALMRANNVKTTLIKAGTAIEVPSCTLQTRARTRTLERSSSKPAAAVSEDDKAKAALAVVDGATWTASTRADTTGDERAQPKPTNLPWRGKLRDAEKLPGDEGYVIRRPSRAYGEPHVIEHLRSSVAVVRALYPEVHTLAIGDLSAEHGGKLDNHKSHQSGLDVDVGFYFRRVPSGYPDRFAEADSDLDIEATWALLTAFARTADVDDGVEIIFLDYAVQKRLYQWAHKRGTPDTDLAAILQYPRGKDSQAGLVRHWPNHADHLHVRFKAQR